MQTIQHEGQKYQHRKLNIQDGTWQGYWVELPA
jgi:hypothetical protein